MVSAVDDDITEEPTLEGGSYEVIRQRLFAEAKTLGDKADALNRSRTEKFGGVTLEVIGNERVRTENNCVPRDIVNIGGTLLFGYNVYIGLRTETTVNDVFSLHGFSGGDDSFALSGQPVDTLPGLLDDERFVREFDELYSYYKDAKLIQVRRNESKLLAVFQTGNNASDIRAFRWALHPGDRVEYIDSRGERDHTYPAAHDFEWIATGRDDQVSGRHPHVNILDEVFVEMVGGDLTVKIEDNTEDGMGIYREPVDDPRQSMDDGEIHYAKVGGLILLKMLPYRENEWRYLVFNTRTHDVRRIDAIGQSCVQLPEDHGIIFPGGYYLQTGDGKVFDTAIDDLVFKRTIRSPNGEDVLYVYYHALDGRYLLLPYNLIKKEVANPIQGHGFTLFEDGKMVVFRSASEEPTRVHPIQIWQTPFVSLEFDAQAPSDDSAFGRIGNAELVRGISDAYSIKRLAEHASPSRQTFEDLIAGINRMTDAYYWLGSAEVGGLKTTLEALLESTERIIDEFEKVRALESKAAEALAEAKADQQALIRDLQPDNWRKVEDFLVAMTKLRQSRGHVITLKDVRYVDTAALESLEKELVEQFDRVSKSCVSFLLTGEALEPLVEQINELFQQAEAVDRSADIKPLEERLDTLNEGLNLLSEVVAGLEVDDPNQRTTILESISEVFGHLNRARATVQATKKEVMGSEGRAEFAAQFKLLGQAVSSAVAMADTPEKCDEQLSRIMVQLEELEGRFSQFDEFLADLTQKRDEVYEALEGKKQQLLDARSRRAENIARAADRILDGIDRRARTFKSDDDLNAYFASDPMIMKLRGLIEQLRELGDSVKADDFVSRQKSAKQNALRNLRDKLDLFEGGDELIKLGTHRFSVNTQSFELTILPRDEDMSLHLTGTDFYAPIADEAFLKTQPFWDQHLVSETADVYRGEYLAARMLFDAERGDNGLTLKRLHAAAKDEAELLELIRKYAADRYDEGYERGLHDADTAKILTAALRLTEDAGRLRYAPDARAWAALYWSRRGDDGVALQRRAVSLARLRATLTHPGAEAALAADFMADLLAFAEANGIEIPAADAKIAGRYLVDELGTERPKFATSHEAETLRDAFVTYLDANGGRAGFEQDVAALEGDLSAQLGLVRAWTEAFVEHAPDMPKAALLETAALLLTDGLDRQKGGAMTSAQIDGLLGQHPSIESRSLTLRLDEFLTRLSTFIDDRVPGYAQYRAVRADLLEGERERLRLDEFKPRVLTSFVRNQLINDVYLPMIGDNLAKQLGAAGSARRTDLMGMLLLISPPGYGKTTLMEYVASRLGMVFMKINGPSLGHEVTSLDPAEAPNATARQEVEKINLAFEMANNVMLYLDDIQHTHPELLQKFISLCDGQRRVEGVWRGRTRTYDLRGKKFCVIMAGNPYTESGEKFQIPDMLANRADTYNLGDILEGKDEVFALSYIENSLTSSPVLAPLAARSLPDVHLLIRVAKGEQVPATDYEHSYSKVELDEAVTVLKHLFRVQDTLLKVNLEYIKSASQDDRFRTEPPFKLQGSYRNMNKLAEKVVAAMNDRELDALIRDHYVGEAQTLTTGAEQNLLKLGELRGTLSADERKRWEEIKKDFRRVTVAGGADDDPVTRVTATLGALGEQLDGIKTSIGAGVEHARKRNGSSLGELLPHLERLHATLEALNGRELAVNLRTEAPEELQALLTAQLSSLEQTLTPMVRTSVKNLEEVRSLGQPLAELIELLKLNALSDRRANGNDTGKRKPSR